MTMFGFYSEGQKKIAGSAIYSSPDGTEVEITEVSATGYSHSLWPDLTYVGEIVKFIRLASPAIPSASYDLDPPITYNMADFAKQESKPTEATSIPDWKRWRNDQPGHCPCGIARQDCWIHKA